MASGEREKRRTQNAEWRRSGRVGRKVPAGSGQYQLTFGLFAWGYLRYQLIAMATYLRFVSFGWQLGRREIVDQLEGRKFGDLEILWEQQLGLATKY